MLNSPSPSLPPPPVLTASTRHRTLPPPALMLALSAMLALQTAGVARAVEATSEAGRALIGAASMEPVDLRPERGRISQLPGSLPNWLPGYHSIDFRVPAAAVSMIDVKDGLMGGQRLGFELWSRALDPVNADLAPDRVGARYRAGEYVLRVMVTNAVGVPGRAERVLRSLSGINPFPRPDDRIDPCDVREDPALGMLVGRAPEGVPNSQACRFGTNGAVLNGKPYLPAHFMRLAPDGAPKFIVKCGAYVAAGEGAPPRPCEMLGYFGAWPLFLRVMSDRAPDWNATFDRVTDYLARHTTFRTD